MKNKKAEISHISFKDKWVSRLDYLRLDNRSLALFRIGLGISILYSLILVRLPYAVEIWGENTIIPVEMMKVLNRQNSYSIFDWIRNDTFAFVYLYFSIFIAFLYTIGFYTKYVSVVLLLLFWNLLQANSAFTFGFDFYTFQMLFWSMFLPLDNFYSVKNTPVRKVSLSISIVLLIQIAWIYFATGVAKYGQSWVGGYAIRNMLLDTGSIKAMGNFFVDKPFFYKPLTYISLVMEYIAPLLIFIKSKNNVLRYAFVVFLLGFHFSIFMMYKVANFSISGISVGLLLLPSHFWDVLLNLPKVIIKKYESNNQYLKTFRYLKYILVCLAIYVISIENIKFFAKNSSLKNKPISTIIETDLSKLSIPSPTKTSFFLQYWKMFAPNPPAKGGWLTLEYLNPKDGFYYDFFTDMLVTNVQSKPPQYFSGIEYYLIYYSRTFVYRDEGFRFREFLKYWIPYIVKKRGGDFESLKDNMFLADYYFEITDQSKPFKPQIKKSLLPVNGILLGDFGRLIE